MTAIEKAVNQQAFGEFTVKCDKCDSENVVWQNDLGYSDISGSWGSAGFICLDCDNETEMVST